MDGQLRIRLLGIGHGDAILLRAEVEGQTWTALIDGGKSRTKLQQRLKEARVERLDLLVLTHFDHDHLGGLVDIASVVPVASYWGPALGAFNRHYWRFGEKSRGPLNRAAEFERQLRATGTEILYPLEGYASAPLGSSGPEVRVHFLRPHD